MSFAEAIGYLTIGPIKLLFEFVFSIAYNLSHSIIASIVLLSLVVNVLVLPLYKRADSIQEEENKIQKGLEKGIKHIRKTFKGDERMMMLQTYYRQNNYNPIFVLRSSVSLLLQIPFFIAAYSFLSNLVMLQGASLGPIVNLGSEDKLITIGSISINVLPVLMTLINIVSGTVFSKGKPVKTKVQLYCTALVFLVLLYRSPSGLVLYWTLNNVFSLVKNVVEKVISNIHKKQGECKKERKTRIRISDISKKHSWLFFATSVFLSILVGMYIPSNVIQSSVTEFTSPYLLQNPICYLFPTMLVSVGFFVIWPAVFYLLSNGKIKNLLTYCYIVIAFVLVTDYMIFGTRNIVMNSILQYTVYPETTISKVIINLALIAFLVLIVFLIYKNKKTVFSVIIPATIIAVGIISIRNIWIITDEFKELYYIKEDLSDGATIKLSKSGNNVIVIMLDRAMGSELPYIMEEFPELKEDFDGFTYYHNTVSFGCKTHTGAPALFGGYEYTPEAMNAKSDIPLRDKHNEALKVMPVLFDEAGYTVTVCDPPYANYRWYPDLSIYDDYPDINSFNLEYKFNPDVEENVLYMHEIRNRNFFCYSLMSCAPVLLKSVIYDKGLYNKEVAYYENGTLSNMQVMESNSTAHGKKAEFMDWYYALDNLSNITDISNDSPGAFVMMDNCITHEPMMLQKPDYSISDNVDNTLYDSEKEYVIDGLTMKMDNPNQISHYHTNYFALKELAKWFDMLKEQDVYDNCRIIIVADHGYNLGQFGLVDSIGNDYEYLMPLLMMKDFNSSGFSISDDFMTNADVVPFAVKEILPNAHNPFTGNLLDGHEKKGELHFLIDPIADIQPYDNVLEPGDWYTVEGDIYDFNNWKYLGNW